MVWACENGHPVREGMFSCPVCRSDDVRERSGVEPAPRATGREAATEAVERLNRFLTTGVSMYVGGALLAALAVVLAASRDRPGGSGFDTVLLLVAGVLSVVGAGFVLVAIVGWGVKLGNEATDPRDAPRTGTAGR